MRPARTWPQASANGEAPFFDASTLDGDIFIAAAINCASSLLTSRLGWPGSSLAVAARRALTEELSGRVARAAKSAGAGLAGSALCSQTLSAGWLAEFQVSNFF